MYDQIDLFSGIGGFALAARWNGVETRLFVELDPFCQRVLKARFGAVADTRCIGQERTKQQTEGLEERHDGPLLIPDIRDVDGTRFRGSWLLTGGFPCQPFSCAGKRKGTADNRYLWPEMCRVIHESQPEWVLAENVSGLLSQDGGMVFERVLADLEDAGYETLPLVIPACGVGAPHRRDRVWIVGHSKCGGGCGKGRIQRPSEDQSSMGEGASTPVVSADCHATDTSGKGLPWREQSGAHWPHGSVAECSSAWNDPWLEVATRLCRVDDGVSSRVDRLRSLGNSIVPQIAYEIIRAMKEAHG